MIKIETILKSIEGNATEFKILCEAGVCSTDLLKDLERALTQGAILSGGIDMVMVHLETLKTRLTDEE
jgi:hypothetical protein